MLYWEKDQIKLYQGNCLEVMITIPDNSIDIIITDPPYGLSFMGKKWDYNVPSVETWEECLRVLKPGGTALIFAGSRTQHRMAVNVEDAGFVLKDCIMWLYGSGFPKATDISKQLDKGHNRKREKRFVGNIKGAALHHKTDNSRVWEMVETNEAVTPEAKQWDGWKSHGLKPAYEPILVAIKPNEGSYANNALKWGVSGLNIDGGRIGTGTGEKKKVKRPNMKGNNYNQGKKNYKDAGVVEYEIEDKGRFPANIILDEEAAKGEKWSRYFYCAKASKGERNAGCEGLEEEEDKRTMSGGADTRIRPIPKNRNNHPTVKPLKLMEYLTTLTKTPTGGVALDPFMGSGTTGVACVNTDRGFIGIDLSSEYCEIAKCRIEHAKKKGVQLTYK